MTQDDRQPWRLGPRGERWFDVGLTLVLLAPVPVFLIYGSRLEAVLMLVQIAPLRWRRSHPVLAFAVVAAGSGVQSLLVDEPLWSQVAFPIAVYSVARHASNLAGIAAMAVGLGGAVVASVVWLRGFYADELTARNVSAYVLTIALIVLVSWTLGTLGRVRQAYVDALVERGERLEREAAQQAALAAIEERHRIAREMHDVVAHSLTTIVVQADGARAAAAHDPAVADPALGTIATTGREAMAELRGMLGLLREDRVPPADPQPRLTDLPALLDDARASGAAVVGTLDESTTAVPDGVALTAYRIVQEALSNVRKHAGPGATATVRVAAESGDLRIEVSDDGRGAAAYDDGRGLGITGMRERVAAHSGELTVGPAPGGGFRVSARIPL